MSCYRKALKCFSQNEPSLLKKIKAAFWFRIKQSWICDLDAAFEQEGMSDILALHPFIYYMCRMHAFMAVGEDLALRQKRIVEHYRFMHRHFSFEQIQALFDRGVTLVAFDLEGRQVEVLLQYDHRMRFEGQLSLKLIVDREEAYYIHFLFSDNTIWIGGIQGMKGFLELNKWFTKQTSGLRPQNFLYYCLTLLAQKLKIDSIQGISSHAHVYQNEEKSMQKIAFSYDAFWEELGGAPSDSDWFGLPVVYPRKSLEAIGSKKRGQ
ncbi:MAG: DUF535 family protein, partial [Hydrogenovibrio sp.]|nr:DUF535 family protein [Hydrogenovibrio sp.]